MQITFENKLSNFYCLYLP